MSLAKRSHEPHAEIADSSVPPSESRRSGDYNTTLPRFLPTQRYKRKKK